MKYFLLLFFVTATVSANAQHEILPTSEFIITGIVKNKLKVRITDLAAFKQDSLDDVIIRNKRGEQKGIATGLRGVLLKNILDSAGIQVDKPKEFSEIVIVLTASDGYKNVYSWSEIYNTDIGNHVYIICEKDGQKADRIKDRILVLSLADTNSGNRHLKCLSKIEVKKVR